MSGNYTPSDFDPELPDNVAEAETAKDAAKEESYAKSYNETKAKEGSESLFDSIFGSKK